MYLLSQIRDKKTWVIVTFPDSRKYSVVPTNWVLKTIDSYGKTVVKCMWPPSNIHVNSESLIEAVEPSDDWNSYKIKLYENGKEYSKYLPIVKMILT